jgi:ElaB/YqjD/DUF883 family membrane-anchored ribosome-binding protein
MNEASSPDQIERDITDLRARISHTLDAVQDKLSPGQVLDQVLSYAKDEGGQMVEGCARAVRRNPLPATLAGVGLAWLLYASNRAEQQPPVQVVIAEDPRRRLQERAAEVAREQAEAGLAWSRSQAERACEASVDYVKRNPLGAAVIALGLGAIVGGLLMPSKDRRR